MIDNFMPGHKPMALYVLLPFLAATALLSLITVLLSIYRPRRSFGSISADVALRHRELAMLRSVGMGDKAMKKMMLIECAFYSIKAILYGLPVSFAITFLLYRIIENGVTGEFTIPWMHYICGAASVLVITAVTMLRAARRFKRLNIVGALHDSGE